MLYNDFVYGRQNITDKAVLEIIKTKEFQRLKGIKQSGIISYVHPKHKITRYEHCIGTYLLLKKFKASREEQIAGLLHDLSHTAFSHVADVVFGSRLENYHEKLYKGVLMKSKIPLILKRQGFSVSTFLDNNHFGLLEQPLPGLCADRIDYFLRDSLELDMDFRKYLRDITIVNGRFVFNKEQSALHFSLGYKTMNELVWENPYKNSLYAVAADILKTALKLKIITPDDFLGTDEYILSKIKNCNNEKLRRYLQDLSEYAKSSDCDNNYSFRVHVKGRYFDPFVLVSGNKFKRLSEINNAYAAMIKFYKNSLKEGYDITLRRK